MNRAFFIILTPVVLVVLGYCLVFWRSGITLPWRELLVPLVVLLGAMLWLAGRKKTRRKQVTSSAG